MDPRVWFPSLALAGRELLTSLRKVHVFAAFALAVAALALVVAGALFPWDELEDLFQGRAWDPAPLDLHEAARFSRTLVQSLLIVLFTGAAVILPGLAGSAIVDEREKDTFDQLRLTLLRPAGIVAGNLVTLFGFLALLMVFLLPVFALTFFFIGVDHRDLLLPITGIIVYSLNFALGGLAASAFCRRSQSALIVSYGYALFIIMGLAVGLAIGEEFDLWQVDNQAVAFTFTPAMIFNQRYIVRYSPVLALSFHVVTGTLCFLFAVWNVRRSRRTAAEIVGGFTRPGRSGARARFWPALSRWLRPDRPRRPLPDQANPVLLTDLRLFLAGKITRIVGVIVMAGIGFVYLDLLFFAGLSRYDDIAGAVSVGVISVLLLIPMLLSRAVVREMELQSLDFLRMTLLTPARIIWGKLGFTAVTMGPVVAVLFFAAALPLLLQEQDKEALVVIHILFQLVFAVFLLLAGVSLLASVLTKRVRAAVLAAYLFAAAGYGIVFLLNCLFFAPFFIMAMIGDSPTLFPILSYRCRNIVETAGTIIDRHDLFWAEVWGQANAVVIAALGLLAVVAAIRYFPERDK